MCVAASGGLLCAEKHRVVAAVAKEKLLFNDCVDVSECAVLGLEERAEAFAWSDDIKPCKRGVVGRGNDTLCSGGSFAKGVALGGGILCVAFKEHDEERAGAQQGRG